MTVLDLARESGVDIPTLCWDANLKSYGACRVCVVEDEKTGALLASCVTPIRSGMVINTRSPRVIERRKLLVKLMLASHPDTCMVCDKGNQCHLRQIASDLGVGWIDLQRLPQAGVISDINPFFERDLGKCILCAKCIRADQELVVEGAIDYLNRGFIARPTTFGDVPLEKSECTFCGTCVAMCPTGALTEKEKTFRGTTNTAVETICSYCACGCHIRLESKDNLLVRARPGHERAVNHGALCVRGSYGYDYAHSPDRLTAPLMKGGNGLQTASWDDALNMTASQLKRIKDKYGPDSLAVLGASRCTNEENYLLQKFARTVLGTNNIDNGSSLSSGPVSAGLNQVLGQHGVTDSLETLEEADVILVAGADVSATAPAVGYAVKRAVKYHGAKLVLIDPWPVKLSIFATAWLKPRPGAAVTVINGLAKLLIDEGMVDKEFINFNTENYQALSQGLTPFTSESVEKVSGISSDSLRLAARLLGGASRAAIVFGDGIIRQTNSTDVVISLANFALLLGHAGSGRARLYHIYNRNNARGAADMGTLPNFLPGYQSISVADVRGRFEERWGTRLPSGNGLTAMEMIEQARAGKLKGMMIFGENPVSDLPKPSLIKEALKSLELLVVSDLFLTETARLASIILPAASFAEKDGTYTNLEGRVQRVRKAITPTGSCQPDSYIIQELASRMGNPLSYSSPEKVMDEIRELVPAYCSVRYPDLDVRPETWTIFSDQHPAPASKIGRFSPPGQIPTAPPSPADYPFTLILGNILYHFGTGERSSRSRRLKKFSPEAWIEISQIDADRLGIKDSEKVRVISPAGQLSIAAQVVNSAPQGILFMPESFPSNPAGELLDIPFDTKLKTAPLKSCPVRLEKVNVHE